MELLHRRCCGLDVHKETVVACLRLVSDGKVTTEVRTFQTTTADLLRLSEWLAANGCTHVAMEATGVYWKPVWHILDDGEFELVLANAAHVKNVPGRKTDVNDAMWLAELLAHGLIRASFVPDTQTQEMRNLLRTRKQLEFLPRAWLSFAPPPCRMPLGQSQCIPQADPRGMATPRFWHRLIRFRHVISGSLTLASLNLA